MRPIDGDELKKLIIEKYSDIAKQKSFIAAGVSVAVRTICMMIEIAPTLTLDDLRPKGRWEVIEDYVSSLGYTVIDGYRCSLCKEESREALDFCGHCGADMRGGDK